MTEACGPVVQVNNWSINTQVNDANGQTSRTNELTPPWTLPGDLNARTGACELRGYFFLATINMRLNGKSVVPSDSFGYAFSTRSA